LEPSIVSVSKSKTTRCNCPEITFDLSGVVVTQNGVCVWENVLIEEVLKSINADLFVFKEINAFVPSWLATPIHGNHRLLEPRLIVVSSDCVSTSIW